MRSLAKLLLISGVTVLSGCSVLAKQEMPHESENTAKEQGMSIPNPADSKTKGKMLTNSDKIISVVQKMSTAMELGMIEEVLAAYERGATLVVQPGMTATGSELREAFKGFISMKPKFNMPKHEVIESGDIALHISPWTMDAVDPATGNPVQQSGLSLAVFRRQPDGNWLMVIDNPHGAVLLSK